MYKYGAILPSAFVLHAISLDTRSPIGCTRKPRLRLVLLALFPSLSPSVVLELWYIACGG